MNLSRRSILTGLIAAPIVVRTPGLLMPVRSWHEGLPGEIRWTVGRKLRPDAPYYPVLAEVSDGRRWLPLPYGPAFEDLRHHPRGVGEVWWLRC